jgi:hypothetical protein
MPKQTTIIHPVQGLIAGEAARKETILAVARRALYTYGATREQYDSIEVHKHGIDGWKISADVMWHDFGFYIRQAFTWFYYPLESI